MEIGIYKPGKKIFFYKNEEDHASWSIEITSIIKMFAEHGDNVYILSDSIQNSIPNVQQAVTPDIKLDKVIVYCGVFNKDINLFATLKKTYECPIEIIVTDLAITPENISAYDTIYLETNNSYAYFKDHTSLDMVETTYLPIGKNILIGFDRNSIDIDKVIANKSIQYYFGGTEKNRLNDYIEYVYRPECISYGKSAFFSYKNYIPYHEHLQMMDRAKYSIVIGDEKYNKIGMVTPRYYECIIHGVIAFVDSKFDPDELYIKHDDFRRVKSFKDLYTKMKILDENQQLYRSILARQYSEISEDDCKGESIYTILSR